MNKGQRRRIFTWALPVSALVASVACVAAAPPSVHTALVRQVTGMVRVTLHDAPATQATEVKVGDLPDSGSTFTTGGDGAMTLRFHPDMTLVELPAAARATVRFSRTDSGGPRRITLHEGRALVSVAPGGVVAFEDAHAEIFVRAGRAAYATGTATAVLLVFDGEATVVNRKTGANDVVGPGGRAVVGADGTTVTRATAREMAAAGLRQNILEVDFWNPATDDYRTLQIEYEARPRAP